MSHRPMASQTYIGTQYDLDESLFQPTNAETQFMASQTGIADPIELKKHIIEVQKEIYSVGC